MVDLALEYQGALERLALGRKFLLRVQALSKLDVQLDRCGFIDTLWWALQ